MTSDRTNPAAEDAWDTRELGADGNYAEKATDIDEQALDSALDLQPISIRLQKSLIEDFKLIAGLSGLGYQPLMRQVLTRFADCEKKRVLKAYVSEAKQRKEEEDRINAEHGMPVRSGAGG
jgi:hypothetical protein